MKLKPIKARNAKTALTEIRDGHISGYTVVRFRTKETSGQTVVAFDYDHTEDADEAMDTMAECGERGEQAFMHLHESGDVRGIAYAVGNWPIDLLAGFVRFFKNEDEHFEFPAELDVSGE